MFILPKTMATGVILIISSHEEITEGLDSKKILLVFKSPHLMCDIAMLSSSW